MSSPRQAISPRVIDALLELGRADQPGTPLVLRDKGRAWKLLMIGDEPWRRWAAAATDEHLRLVIRGLILYYRVDGRPTGGSVSPVIPLYREFIARYPGDDPEFTSWIVRNRRNEYDPFGTTVHGDATTLQEFRAYQRRRALSRAEGEARNRELQRGDVEAKAERATGRLAGAAKSKTVWCIFDNTALGHAARNAIEMLRLLNP